MEHRNTDHWDPEQYKKFHGERSRPFWDLTKKINFDNVFSLLDIGCGTGELTQSLHLAHQVPKTLGIDSSPSMLSESARYEAEGLQFQVANVESFKPPAGFDLVISNAALQWVDRHESIFGRILGWLNSGGILAVQMPVNFDHPSHRIAERVAPDFGLKPRGTPVLAPEAYARLLWNAGLNDIDVWVKVYLHPLPSAADVVEWTKGTLLTHYQKQLSAPRYEEFLNQYKKELLKDTGEGSYLYTFKRLFLIARKG